MTKFCHTERSETSLRFFDPFHFDKNNINIVVILSE